MAKARLESMACLTLTQVTYVLIDHLLLLSTMGLNSLKREKGTFKCNICTLPEQIRCFLKCRLAIDHQRPEAIRPRADGDGYLSRLEVFPFLKFESFQFEQNRL